MLIPYYTDKQGWKHYIRIIFPLANWWGILACFLLLLAHNPPRGLLMDYSGIAFVIFFYSGMVRFGKCIREAKG